MGDARVVQIRGADEGSLLERAKAGDRAAFEHLFRRNLTEVVRLLTHLLGHDPEVPDLANEVMLLAWRRLAKLTVGLRFGAYLNGVCVNVARNRLRSRRRWSWLVFGRDDDDSAQEHQGDLREALSATEAILSSMNEDLRICFVLRYLEGHELTEVAGLQGVSLTTVKRWLRKAQATFLSEARKHPALEEWVESGTRFGGVA